jgi:hypothetical protein
MNNSAAVGIRRAEHATPLCSQELALTSSTRGGRSVGIVRSRNKATEFVLLLLLLLSSGTRQNVVR